LSKTPLFLRAPVIVEQAFCADDEPNCKYVLKVKKEKGIKKMPFAINIARSPLRGALS
jgi:hypothetical protein